jgi:hypothetical protein
MCIEYILPRTLPPIPIHVILDVLSHEVKHLILEKRGATKVVLR